MINRENGHISPADEIMRMDITLLGPIDCLSFHSSFICLSFDTISDKWLSSVFLSLFCAAGALVVMVVHLY